MPLHAILLAAARPNRILRLGTLALTAAVIATPARAQFNPGPNPISGTTTATQTLSGGTGTVAATGFLNVNSSTVAITVNGSSTLTNNGTIQQAGTARAIDLNTANVTFTINNNAGATIQSTNSDTFRVNKPTDIVVLNNYGTIASLNTSNGSNQTINWNVATTTGSDTLNNFSTGSITANAADAVRPGTNGTVSNSGTIMSTSVNGSGSDGIDAQTNSGVTIVNAASAGPGMIEGGRHGITGGNTTTGVYSMSVTNNLGGTIKGDNGSGLNIDGINGQELVTIVNHGTITGNGHDIGDAAGHDGDGVDVDGLVNLTNTGTIKSINAFAASGIEFSEGVTVGGGTIINSGTIQGSVANGNTTAIGRGITIGGVDKDASGNPITVQAPYAATAITNQAGGLIKGDSDSAIIFSSPLASGFSHLISNEAGGTIQTGSTTAPAILTAADNVTINNSGTIDGSSSGQAITGGSGNLTVNYNAGSIIGALTGGTGTNTLSLGAGVTHNYATANFQNVNVAAGTGTLAGVVSGTNLTKGGAGTLNLTAANTYTGGTTVSTGTLLVNNSTGSGTGSGAVLVQSGAILGGGGLIGGLLTVNGIIAPGNSIGTLRTGDSVVWNSSVGNNWNFELGAANTSDNLNVGGDFIKGTGSNFYFDFLNSTATGTFALVDWSGNSAFSASDFGYTGLGGGHTGSFAINGKELDFTVIPEPATTSALLGMLAFGAVVALRRRRTAG